jgi:hypothetical protein
MHAEDGRHQGHVVVAPDTTVVIDDIGWDTHNPKGDMDSDVLVVFRHKLYLPSLRLGGGSGGSRERLFACVGCGL